MSMIERIARAICLSDLTYDGFGVSAKTLDVKYREDEAFYLAAAKAALSALEEPSDDMISRGLSASGYSASGRDEVAWIFKRMIRAAKGEQG